MGTLTWDRTGDGVISPLPGSKGRREYGERKLATWEKRLGGVGWNGHEGNETKMRNVHTT